MSAKQRADAEAMRAKYARTFSVAIDNVKLELLEDGDAVAYHETLSPSPLPPWRLGSTSAQKGTP